MEKIQSVHLLVKYNRKLSYITVGLIGFTFLILFVCMNIPAVDFSPVSDQNFRTVFGQSQYIIIGSICAFIVSQFVDSSVFWMLRNKTGKKMIWLRATGSTVVSQLVENKNITRLKSKSADVMKFIVSGGVTTLGREDEIKSA